jgi:hypothetical protein
MSQLLGKIGLVVLFKALMMGANTNAELNKFIKWNQASPLANPKPNPLHISGESSGEVRSRSLHSSYLWQRSFTIRRPAASKLCPIYRQRHYPNDLKPRFGRQQLLTNSQSLVKCKQGIYSVMNKPPPAFLNWRILLWT